MPTETPGSAGQDHVTDSAAGQDFAEALALSIADMLDAQLGIIDHGAMPEPFVNARKVSGTAQVSSEMAMDYGPNRSETPPTSAMRTFADGSG